GLVGALLVGAGVARSLAWALEVPAIGVHHMEGHLLAPLMEDDPPQPPFVALLVSGGHTQLVAVDAIGRYRLLGETLDDAAGEAFDKTAKMMGLPYPGGPQLAALAEQGRPGAYRFSRPMTDRPGLDFSFSGLKTQVLLAWRDSDQSAQTRADIARGFEDAVVDTLAIKCERALEAAGCDVLVVAGGVGANKRLRARLQEAAQRRGGRVCFPRPELCTDNGAMIAFAGALRLQAGQHSPAEVKVTPRGDMATLPPLHACGCARPPNAPAAVDLVGARAASDGGSGAATAGSATGRYHVASFTATYAMDKVFIEGLEIDALIGIYDWERRIRQTLVFYLEMGFDNRRPAATDDIADTLNYKAVSKRLMEFVRASEFGLVETLAERCAQIVLDEFGVQWLRLKLSKPGAVRGARAVGVVIERTAGTA